MIKTVASLELPVNEKLLIRKNVITPEQVTDSEKRFCVVTGKRAAFSDWNGDYPLQQSQRIYCQCYPRRGFDECKDGPGRILQTGDLAGGSDGRHSVFCPLTAEGDGEGYCI